MPNTTSLVCGLQICACDSHLASSSPTCSTAHTVLCILTAFISILLPCLLLRIQFSPFINFCLTSSTRAASSCVTCSLAIAGYRADEAISSASTYVLQRTSSSTVAFILCNDVLQQTICKLTSVSHVMVTNDDDCTGKCTGSVTCSSSTGTGDVLTRPFPSPRLELLSHFESCDDSDEYESTSCGLDSRSSTPPFELAFSCQKPPSPGRASAFTGVNACPRDSPALTALSASALSSESWVS